MFSQVFVCACMHSLGDCRMSTDEMCGLKVAGRNVL